jgi:hypothetical protein
VRCDGAGASARQPLAAGATGRSAGSSFSSPQPAVAAASTAITVVTAYRTRIHSVSTHVKSGPKGYK